MTPEIRAAVARIEAGGSRGTGVLVRGMLGRRDLVLTALHVVADADDDPPAPYGEIIAVEFPNHSAIATLERWNVKYDWALLRCEQSLPVEPLALYNLKESGVEFEGYGFPDAQPVDGITVAGQVRNHRGEYQGTRAIQVFCEEAAAGNGMPVKGLSGAPCLYQGAVIGVFRASLMREGEGLNIGGTLYACPVGVVADAARDLLEWPDPCLGLPGVDAKLPQEPFRYLAPYEADDAALFSGRCREIALLSKLLNSERPAPVVIVHGESGVGKSSLLHAGFLPRSRQKWLYARRDPVRGLGGSLTDLLGAFPVERWQQIDAGEGPLLIVLDQLEEIWTRPLIGRDELGELLSALGPALASPQLLRGCLVLSLRTEWFKSVEERLRAWKGLRWDEVQIGRLDREAIIEIVTALTPAGALRDPYRLDVKPADLPASIADDLLEDPLSPVAPVLQILLTRLWMLAKGQPDSDGRRVISKELYLLQKAKGIHLEDFLDQQLAVLHSDPELVDTVNSGLALDVLAFHVTSLDSAESRSNKEITGHYAGRPKLLPLLGRLQDLYLLGSTPGAIGGTRLAHDTLGRHVHARFAASQAPGQRASRILAARASQWSNGVEGPPLEEIDLGLVEAGKEGMRAWTDDEQRLIAASRRRRSRARLRRKALYAAAILVLALITYLWRRAEYETDTGLSRQLAVASALAIDQELDRALLLAVQAQLASPTVQARGALLNAIWHSPIERFLYPGVGVSSLGYSNDGRVLAAGHTNGTITLWDTQSGTQIGKSLAGHPNDCEVTGLAFDSSGQLLASGCDLGKNDGPSIRLYNLTSHEPMEPRLPTSDGVRSVSFNPRGQLLSGGGTFDRHFRLWDVSTHRLLYVSPHLDEAVHATFCGAPDVIALGTQGGRIYLASAGTAEAPKQIVDIDGSIRSIACSYDGRLVAAGTQAGIGVGSTDDLVLIDVASKKVIPSQFKGHTGAIWSVSFNRAGTLLASGSVDQTVRLWSVPGRKALPTPDQIVLRTDGVFTSGEGPYGQPILGSHRTTAHAGQSVHVAFSPDGQLLASGSGDGIIKLWRVETIDVPAKIDANTVTPTKFTRRDLHASVDAPGRLILQAKGGRLELWDSNHDSYLSAVPCDDEATDARVATDSRSLLAVCNGVLKLWDIERPDRPIARDLPELSGITAAAVNGASRTIAAIHPGDRSAVILTADTNAAMRRRDVAGNFSDVAVSPTGLVVAFRTTTDELLIIDTSGSTLTQSSVHIGGSFGAVAFGSDSTLFAEDESHSIVGWRIHSHWLGPPAVTKTASRFVGHTNALTAIVGSTTGDLLLSASEDGSVRLWDTATGQQIGRQFKLDDLIGVGFDRSNRNILFTTAAGTQMRPIDGDLLAAAACTIANRSLSDDEWRMFVGSDRSGMKACSSVVKRGNSVTGPKIAIRNEIMDFLQ